jgi:hypothetical protein
VNFEGSAQSSISNVHSNRCVLDPLSPSPSSFLHSKGQLEPLVEEAKRKAAQKAEHQVKRPKKEG